MGALLAFDAAPPDEATQLLRPCCASAAWQVEVVAGRPYRSLAALEQRSDELLAVLDWDEIAAALAAHPRIGESVSGTAREAAWSRQEQADAARGDTDAQEALRRGNAEYEERFGHVFLISATGHSAADVLQALTDRLEHRPTQEREVVRRELAAIVRHRLGKTFTAGSR
jgi:2-oxo-4-hydroxy-4-carboxy-5-ureidoimidazoline decarboxylase